MGAAPFKPPYLPGAIKGIKTCWGISEKGNFLAQIKLMPVADNLFSCSYPSTIDEKKLQAVL